MSPTPNPAILSEMVHLAKDRRPGNWGVKFHLLSLQFSIRWPQPCQISLLPCLGVRARKAASLPRRFSPSPEITLGTLAEPVGPCGQGYPLRTSVLFNELLKNYNEKSLKKLLAPPPFLFSLWVMRGECKHPFSLPLFGVCPI